MPLLTEYGGKYYAAVKFSQKQKIYKMDAKWKTLIFGEVGKKSNDSR